MAAIQAQVKSGGHRLSAGASGLWDNSFFVFR